MSSSPQLEFIQKVRSTAAKKLEMASEALLNARETDEGPVFNENQNANLAAICNQKGVDPVEFLAAYTPYVRSRLPPKATGPELMAFVEKAVKECPEPAEIIGLWKKKSGRQPSGEPPAEKLERLYQDLHTEREKARIASQYNEQLVKINKDSLNIAWQLFTTQLRKTVKALNWNSEVRHFCTVFKLWKVCSYKLKINFLHQM